MGAVFAIFGSFYYWFAKFFGYLYNEMCGRSQFIVLFIGANGIFTYAFFRNGWYIT